MTLTFIQRIARQLMLLKPNEPRYSPTLGADFREVFDHPDYLALPPATQRDCGNQWAQALYDQECARPLVPQFFEHLDPEPLLRDKAILDIGCYIGGKTVRWAERYHAASAHGIDIDQRFIDVANAFAAEKGINAKFSVGFAENLEFADASFDAILTENTFEHVRDVDQVLSECRRVLKPGGLLFVIFPSFYGHKSHHLDLVTRTPFIHWLFSFRDILAAYHSIIDTRGPAAAWYRRNEREPLPYERGNSINGMSAGRFRDLIDKAGWSIVADGFVDMRSADEDVLASLAHLLRRNRIGAVRNLFPIAYVLRRPAD